MRRDHADDAAVAREQRRALAGADTGSAIRRQVIGARHECAFLDVVRDDAAAGAQRRAACAAVRMRADPFPEFRSFRVEPAKRQQAELSPLAAFGMKHLHAGEVGTHDGDRGVHDVLIESRRVRLVNQLRAELLQQLRICQLGFELRATLPQCVFGLPAFRGFGAGAEHSDDRTAFVAHR